FQKTLMTEMIGAHHEAKKTYQAQEARPDCCLHNLDERKGRLVQLNANCDLDKKTEVNDKIKCIALDQYLEGQYQRAQNIGIDMPKSSIIIGQANNTQADLKLHPQGLRDLLV
ncbi:hypothetical protein ACJX0J_034507, partial [Zea mays]